MQRKDICRKSGLETMQNICCPKVPSNHLLILPQQNYQGVLFFLAKPLLCVLLIMEEKDAVLTAYIDSSLKTHKGQESVQLRVIF